MHMEVVQFPQQLVSSHLAPDVTSGLFQVGFQRVDGSSAMLSVVHYVVSPATTLTRNSVESKDRRTSKEGER